MSEHGESSHYEGDCPTCGNPCPCHLVPLLRRCLVLADSLPRETELVSLLQASLYSLGSEKEAGDV